MNRLRWRWVLPLVQVALAIAAFIYGPYEYRAGPHPVGDDFMLRAYQQLWPPVVERVSIAINFPAYAAVVPVNFTHWSGELRYNYGRLSILFELQDVLFFCGVGVLWYWLGIKLDRRLESEAHVRSPVPKSVAVARMIFGVVFALALGFLAFELLTSSMRPQMQVGPFGLIWSIALLFHFSRKFVATLRPASTSALSLL